MDFFKSATFGYITLRRDALLGDYPRCQILYSNLSNGPLMVIVRIS